MTSTASEGIIVLGHPRSGTTMLRRILNGHDNLHCPGETHVLSACARFISSEITADGLDMGVLSGMHFAGTAGGVVKDKIRDLGLDLLSRSVAETGKRWVEKTAADTFYIDEIDLLFGDHAKFVGIIRHGVDVAISSKDFSDAMGMHLNMFKPYIQAYEQPIEAFLRSWMDITQKMMSFAERHPENCMLIRYEDLVAEPNEVLQHLCDFIGEEFQTDMVTKGLGDTSNLGLSDHKALSKSTVDTSMLNRWKSLTPYQLARLAKIANPLLATLGYDEIPTDAATDVESARRRFEMGLFVGAK